jgi:hypothetical protein
MPADALFQGRSGQSPTNPWAQFAIFAALLVIISTCIRASGQTPASARPGAEYSGVYSFLREGEFVQITVEDAGRVSGFVARFGDLESDKGATLDHFFKTGRLDGNRLSFTTEVVHGVSFEFQGTISRSSEKKVGEEGYYLIEGKLAEVSSDEAGKRSSKERVISMRSMPRRSESPGQSPQ